MCLTVYLFSKDVPIGEVIDNSGYSSSQNTYINCLRSELHAVTLGCTCRGTFDVRRSRQVHPAASFLPYRCPYLGEIVLKN
ncbi:unnamed protein product [Allacma fusca]|uniref:Uncharacterized protein n=1 Tax=Allacma fusca TaxID=39272 RepID=A0A8J2L1X6_9HEXA|nr:unnamed protein product [Allacma fusca]